MWDAKTVAITYGLRGLLYYDLKLHNPSRDLHSGMYGGTLANPAVELTAVLGGLFDKKHRVTIPGVLRRRGEGLRGRKKQWARLGFDEFKHCLKPIGVKSPTAKRASTTLERRWARPTYDINGLYGGYGGPGAKTVIPSFAGAKVSFRLGRTRTLAKIGKAFEASAPRARHARLPMEITKLSGSHLVVVPADSPHIAAASRHRAHLRPAARAHPRRATIPVVGDFGAGPRQPAHRLLRSRTMRSTRPTRNSISRVSQLGCTTLAGVLAEFANVCAPRQPRGRGTPHARMLRISIKTHSPIERLANPSRPRRWSSSWPTPSAR